VADIQTVAGNVMAANPPDLLAEVRADCDHFREMWKTEVANGQRLALDYQQARDRAEKAEAEAHALRAAARTLLANPGVTKCPGGAELKAALEEGS
jgi:hypothetical protein